MLTSCGHRWKDSSMVDYAMDIGEAGSEYERPVQAPSITSAGIAAGFLKGVGDMIDTYGSSVAEGRPTEAGIKREGYASFIQELDGIKGKRPLDQQVELRSIITRYESKGFPLGEAELRAIETRTGIDASKYMVSSDPNVAMAAKAMNTLAEKPEFSLLARKTLVQEGITEPTNQQILERSLSLIATNEAAVLHVTTSNNISQAGFEETAPLWMTTLKTLRDTGLESLNILSEGGNLSPEAVMGFKDRLDTIKSVMTKPKGVTAESWQGVQNQIDGLEVLVNRIATYDQDKLDAMSLDAFAAISERLLKQGDYLLAAALADEGVMSDYIAKNGSDLLEAMNKVKAESIQYDEISFADYDTLAENFAGIPSMTDAAEIKATLAAQTLHTEEMTEKAKALEGEERLAVIKTFSGIDVAGMSINGITQNQEVRQVFANGVGGAALAVSTANELFEISTLSELFNMDTHRKLEAFIEQNPQVGNGLKMKMRDALHNQRTILGKSAQSGLMGTRLLIDEKGKVRFDKLNFWSDTILRNFSAEEESEIKAFHLTYYDGDFEAMIKDGGRKIKEGDPRLFQKIKETSGEGNRVFEEAQKEYNGTMKYQNTMTFLEKQLKALKAGAIELDAMMYRPMRPTRQQREDFIVAAATAPQPTQPTEVDLLAQEAVDAATAPIDGIQTTALPDLGTESNPYEPQTEDDLKAIPSGAYFLGGGKLWKKD